MHISVHHAAIVVVIFLATAGSWADSVGRLDPHSYTARRGLLGAVGKCFGGGCASGTRTHSPSGSSRGHAAAPASSHHTSPAVSSHHTSPASSHNSAASSHPSSAGSHHSDGSHHSAASDHSQHTPSPSPSGTSVGTTRHGSSRGSTTSNSDWHIGVGANPSPPHFLHAHRRFAVAGALPRGDEHGEFAL